MYLFIGENETGKKSTKQLKLDAKGEKKVSFRTVIHTHYDATDMC